MTLAEQQLGKAEQRKQVQAIMEAFSKHLPGSWVLAQRSDPQYSDAWVEHADRVDPRRCLRFTWGPYGRRDRITIRAVYHAPGPYPSIRDTPEITVAQTKTPEQIAKDVTRRLLEDARDYWDQYAHAKGEEDRAEAGRLATLAALKPYGVEELKHGGYYCPSQSKEYDKGYVRTCNINYGGGSVELDLRSLTVGKAQRILAIVNEDKDLGTVRQSDD